MDNIDLRLNDIEDINMFLDTGVKIIEPDGGDCYNVYSTEETVIGTWLGKPLYRKVIVTDTIDLSKGNHGLANLDASYLVKYLQCIFNSSAGQFVLGSNNSDVKHKGNKIETSVTVDWGSGYVEIVVEYTKTTD